MSTPAATPAVDSFREEIHWLLAKLPTSQASADAVLIATSILSMAVLVRDSNYSRGEMVADAIREGHE